MKTIVSVTPLQVTADSRTFKIAASFSRFGYRSIVIEGEKSKVDQADLPFEIGAGGDFLATKDSTVSSSAGSNQLGYSGLKLRLKKWVKRQPCLVQRLLMTLIGPPYYVNNYVLRPIKEIPIASLYYLHAPYQFPAAYWWSRRSTAPIIYDAHDFYPVLSPNVFYSRKIEAWCIRESAAVVTVSDGVARLMRQEFGCEPVILRNCEDMRLNSTPKQDLRETLGLSRDVFLIVLVGQAKSGQAIPEALQALSGLEPFIHFVFVGKNTENYRDMVVRSGLQARVHFVPPVKPTEVVPFIKSADASLILYFSKDVDYENALPNKFFQAVSAELPLLYPELPEIKKLAVQYGLGIPVDTKSPDSIKSGILRLVQKRDVFDTLKKNLRIAKKTLSWEQEEVILYDLVRGIIGESPSVAS